MSVGREQGAAPAHPLRITNYDLQVADCRLQIADCRFLRPPGERRARLAGVPLLTLFGFHRRRYRDRGPNNVKGGNLGWRVRERATLKSTCRIERAHPVPGTDMVGLPGGWGISDLHPIRRCLDISPAWDCRCRSWAAHRCSGTTAPGGRGRRGPAVRGRLGRRWPRARRGSRPATGSRCRTAWCHRSSRIPAGSVPRSRTR